MKKLFFLKLLLLVIMTSCSKEISNSLTVGDLVNVFKENPTSIENIFGYIDQNEDIKLTFHHYDNGDEGRFKLMKYTNSEMYSNIDLAINGKEVRFTENHSVLRGEEALFLNEYYGSQNSVVLNIDGKEKIEYELSFPKKLSISSNTQSYMIPNKTKLTWEEDKESDSLIGILVEYHNANAKPISNYKILPDNGNYIIDNELFAGIPEDSKVYFRAFRGKYVKDKKNSLRMIIFSADYSTEFFTSKYPSL